MDLLVSASIVAVTVFVVALVMRLVYWDAYQKGR